MCTKKKQFAVKQKNIKILCKCTICNLKKYFVEFLINNAKYSK